MRWKIEVNMCIVQLFILRFCKNVKQFDGNGAMIMNCYKFDKM